MADICRYTFEDAHGNNPWDTVVFEDHEAVEAREFAREHELRLICNTYEWVDSEMVEDFTPLPAPTVQPTWPATLVGGTPGKPLPWGDVR